MKKYIIVDRHGWPVTRIKGRPIFNALRLLIHARGIVTRASFDEAVRKRMGGPPVAWSDKP